VLGDTLLAADCGSKLVPYVVVVVVVGPMQHENDLPKQLMLWATGCPHTLKRTENIMKQYAGPASADSIVLRLQLFLFVSGS
jgi:hypothetical protein